MEQAEVERLILKPTTRRRLGKYVLLGRLGHGGMGKIYLAYLPGPAGIEKLLVIKRLHSHLTSDRALVTSFLDEARLSMALSHPNIVHTYDVGEIDGRYFMVMEYIDGQNLGVLLRTSKRSGSYPPSTLWAGLMVGVLEGLHAAHVAKDARGRSLNIIHRDVSPQNVLVTYDGGVKLVDFGIAKAAMRVNETDAGVLKGKYAYMSPEQCESAELDARSDVFSAGVVFWEMLAGRRLYKSDSVLRSVERILNEPPISPVKVNPEADPALATVVLKALQKKRADRFASAEEFRDAVDDVLRTSTRHFRKQDLRDLMHGVFSDVIEKQRAVLDACLSGNATVEDDDDGASSTSRKRGGDSESDLAVPSLKLGGDTEPTTPSAFRVSPLITREDDGPAPKRPGILPPDASGPLLERAPSDAVTSASLPIAPAPSSTKPPDRDREGRQGFVPLALALSIVLLGALFGTLYAMGLLDGPLGIAGDDMKGGPSTTSEPRGPAPARVSRAPTTVERAPPAQRDPPPAVDDRPDREEPVRAGADPKTAREENDDDDAQRRRRPTTRRPTKGKDDETSERTAKKDEQKRDEPKTTAKVDEPVKPPEEKPAPREEPAVVETGFVTIDTVPWTIVSLGGKVLGNTPLIGVKVPAGELTFRLKNPEEGIDQEYIVVVKPGQTTKKRLGLK